jgi:hypothetical protein
VLNGTYSERSITKGKVPVHTGNSHGILEAEMLKLFAAFTPNGKISWNKYTYTAATSGQVNLQIEKHLHFFNKKFLFIYP